MIFQLEHNRNSTGETIDPQTSLDLVLKFPMTEAIDLNIHHSYGQTKSFCA